MNKFTKKQNIIFFCKFPTKENSSIYYIFKLEGKGQCVEYLHLLCRSGCLFHFVQDVNMSV